MTYHSAAKINLLLEVEGVMPNRYHRLVSVMQSVSLFDSLDFDFERRDFSLQFNDDTLDLGPVEKNIITRSWRLMKERFDLPGEVAVNLEKRIPVGAGLAGGSGNGAAMFHAVNDYFRLELSMEELAALGGEVGADIPFCIRGGTMLARGKGEILEPLTPLKDVEILLVNGGFSVSTAEVFRRFDALDPAKNKPKPERMMEGLVKGDMNLIQSCLYNDLEAVTMEMAPSLVSLKSRLTSEGLKPLMSGSGPTVFALVSPEQGKILQKKWNPLWGTLFRCAPIEQGICRL